MPKTNLTRELEKKLWESTDKTGVFGGFRGIERVDYVTYDTKGIWRFYEIKVSKEDFHSKATISFLGHFNYYVMPATLYEEVKDEIPNYVGVFTGVEYIRRAKRQELVVDENILKDSLIRSLNRERQKFWETCDTNYVNNLKNKINELEKKINTYKHKYYTYSNAIFEICERYKLDYEEVKKFIRNR